VPREVVGGRLLPYMGGSKGYGFSGVLVINKVSILAILVLSRVWFLHFSLELHSRAYRVQR